MELSVVTTENVPQGCVLSFRAGAHRRQMPVEVASPLKFPVAPADVNPFRVDILQPLGTSRVLLKPGEPQYTVPVDGGRGSSMSVTFTIRDNPGAFGLCEDGSSSHLPPPASPAPTPGQIDSHVAEGDARAYLEEHQVVRFVQALLKTIVRERPADPYAFIAQQFCSHDASGSRAPVVEANKDSEEALTTNSGLPSSIQPVAETNNEAEEGVDLERVEPVEPLTAQEAPTAELAQSTSHQPVAESSRESEKGADLERVEHAAPASVQEPRATDLAMPTLEVLRERARALLVEAERCGDISGVVPAVVSLDPGPLASPNSHEHVGMVQQRSPLDGRVIPSRRENLQTELSALHEANARLRETLFQGAGGAREYSATAPHQPEDEMPPQCGTHSMCNRGRTC